MKEKVLILASVASMIDQFNMSNIEILQKLNYEVHVACNFNQGSTCSNEKIEQLKENLKQLDIKYFQVDFTRTVYNFAQDFRAYRQVKKIMIDNHYKFIHCHSPIGGAIGRLVCKSTKTKCIYTAHGFHFFKGAPIQNWLIFYPIEKILSKYTDILITINKEDYERAKQKFHMKKLEYVPGVGINPEKFQLKNFDKGMYKESLGFEKDDFLILSIGELNRNKNHEVVIDAIGHINNSKIKYMIVGQGNLKDNLEDKIETMGLSDNIKLLNFRNDIPELLNCADLFVFPSKREGLSVALMEAMASGIPCVVSKIRGNTDLIKHGENGYCFNYNDAFELSIYIKNIMSDSKIKKHYLHEEFFVKNVMEKMKKIYKEA